MSIPAYDIDRVHSYEINGIPLETGDLICTVDGDPSADMIGQFWWIVGKLVPGDVDHIVIYTGPGGRCVEAGAKARVIAFDVPGGKWVIRPDTPEAVYTDREDILEYLHKAARDTPERRTRSLVLLGKRRTGKTEVFRRVVNRLFFEQDPTSPKAVVPVFQTLTKVTRPLQRNIWKTSCDIMSAFTRRNRRSF